MKRFHCSARWREKIRTLVVFPHSGLDMSGFVSSNSAHRNQVRRFTRRSSLTHRRPRLFLSFASQLLAVCLAFSASSLVPFVPWVPCPLSKNTVSLQSLIQLGRAAMFCPFRSTSPEMTVCCRRHRKEASDTSRSCRLALFSLVFICALSLTPLVHYR